MIRNLFRTSRRLVALALMVLLSCVPVLAGLTINGSNGITASGADGINYVGTNGITASGADGILAFGPNGITASGADGITASGADGITASGADSTTITRADGITASGADGITISGADGTTYHADSVIVRNPSGITASGADNVIATGTNGITASGADTRGIVHADGITASGANNTVTINGSDGIIATSADGIVFTVTPSAITISGVNGITASGADGITISAASSFVQTGVGALTSVLNGANTVTGLQSLDPELAVLLNRLTDDSNVDAVIIYHHLPSDADIADLQSIGVLGGTRYRSLPMIAVTTTKRRITAISQLPAVRSIYSNRTLQWNLDSTARNLTGVELVRRNTDLTRANRGLPVSGHGITVAVLDTGVDGTHGDLAGRVVQNIKLADTQSLGVGFNYPIAAPNLSNTDQAYGHGTFVSGVIAGNGQQSGGKYAGVAPGANILGLSAGDASLLFVLSGLDYLLTNSSSFNVRVVNCSFSANTVFDANDPVNIATRMLTDAGVNVVFSAGNTGPGAHTLNPYAVAPWVISVGATDTKGRLASFSSRGDFANSMFHPTLVAPGVNVVSLRGSGVANVTGASGIAGADTQRLSATELPYYTTANGTSFSAPQVAGAIALMLEANPNLAPAAVKDILQRTATPLPPYYTYESGTVMLNVHAAVLEAAYPARRIGAWRGIVDRRQVQFLSDAPLQFSGTVQPGTATDISVPVPEGAVTATVQISWGPLWSTNDLALAVYDQTGTLRGQANAINLTGLNGKHETLSFIAPNAGTWHVSVSNTLGAFGTPQQFSGVLEVGRAQYAPLNDIDSFSPALKGDVYQNLRSFSMWPIGSRFRADFGVSRLDLATALVMSARVPQYLPGQSNYTDVRDPATRLFVESVQGSPTGSLFIDATNGGQFRPYDGVIRLTAAIALVRAAGLRSDAEAKSGTPLPYLDAAGIPSQLKGYVAVAVSAGLLQADTNFRPQAALSRADLAHAITVIETRAIQ